MTLREQANHINPVRNNDPIWIDRVTREVMAWQWKPFIFFLHPATGVKKMTDKDDV